VQGYPVLIQADSSEDGQELAAATAELVFTAQQTLAGAQAFYSGLKARLAQHGRGTDELLILPGVMPIIGATEAEAKARYDQLQEWFENGAADGFNILAPTFPHGLEALVDLVIPELQRRGLFRTEYSAAFPKRRRQLALGLFSSAQPIGMALGVALGGYVATHWASWPCPAW